MDDADSSASGLVETRFAGGICHAAASRPDQVHDPVGQCHSPPLPLWAANPDTLRGDPGRIDRLRPIPAVVLVRRPRKNAYTDRAGLPAGAALLDRGYT